MKIKTITKELAADLVTPIGVFMSVRKNFPQSVLLESSDYHGGENSYSFIGVEPIAEFKVLDGNIIKSFNGSNEQITKIDNNISLPTELENFVKSFELEEDTKATNGLFGYTGYECIKYFDDVKISNQDIQKAKIPDMIYRLYRYVIAINHFKNTMTILENITENQSSKMDSIIPILENNQFEIEKFETIGKEFSTITDQEYKDMVTKGKYHCLRGDVFQIVLSRLFCQEFKGDDFNVYRSLRRINPSPYLFYFSYQDFAIMGSSPESEIIIKGQKATICPIAGTVKRTGNDAEDTKMAEILAKDPKENAEHTMLVDLARNDLGRNGINVRVETYKELQYYSHVIHMVSTVCADITKQTERIKIMADTFPAGTLSGAPKIKAMELIDKYEKQGRGYYAGCLGLLGFNGDVIQAITIRSFLSKNNTLYYQAGAGITIKSNEESELQEVNNKLGALKKAIELA